MRRNHTARNLVAMFVASLAVCAMAKLPPLSDDAKAKAAENAAKSAWTDKVGAYRLCQAMNRTAEYHRQSVKSAGKAAPVAVDTPDCTDPGPFVLLVDAVAKPLEAAGAHSSPEMATSPPNSNATAAEIQGQPKK